MWKIAKVKITAPLTKPTDYKCQPIFGCGNEIFLGFSNQILQSLSCPIFGVMAGGFYRTCLVVWEEGVIATTLQTC